MAARPLVRPSRGPRRARRQAPWPATSLIAGRALSGLRHVRRRLRSVPDAGMATAEYAIATLAACGFAGLLIAIMRSDEVRGLLTDVIRRALAFN